MIRERLERIGPSWKEILVSLGCTILVATDVLYGRSSTLPQSAESYYFAYPQVRFFHAAHVTVDVAFLVMTLLWIVFPVTGKLSKLALIGIALTGFALCWSELVWATTIRSAPLFHLTELPFRPIGNTGVLGSQIFATYLLFRAPSGKISEWQAGAIKIGLAVCFWFFQLLVWDGIRRFAGSGA